MRFMVSLDFSSFLSGFVIEVQILSIVRFNLTVKRKMFKLRVYNSVTELQLKESTITLEQFVTKYFFFHSADLIRWNYEILWNYRRQSISECSFTY
jgi:hypothetical protein